MNVCPYVRANLCQERTKHFINYVLGCQATSDIRLVTANHSLHETQGMDALDRARISLSFFFF